MEEHNGYAIGLHRGHAAHQGDVPRGQGQRRRQQPLVLVPRQRPRARGDALGLPLPRHPRRHGHGHRQRGPARGLRGHPEGPARARRGRAARPASRRHRAARGLRRDGQGRGQEGRAGPGLARGHRSKSASRTPWCTASSTSSRGHRGGAAEAARGPLDVIEGPADGGHEGRGRPLRRGQDVPAPGGQERPRHEEGRRLPRALHGGREGAGRRRTRPQGKIAARDGQGRRARHRQEHRRRGARLQQLRGHRPGRDGAGGDHPPDRARREGRRRRPERPHHAVPRRDGARRARDAAPGLRAAAAHRRRHHEPPAHGREDRARLRARDGPRAGRLARRQRGLAPCSMPKRREAFDAKNRDEQQRLRRLFESRRRPTPDPHRGGARQRRPHRLAGARTCARPAFTGRRVVDDVEPRRHRGLHRLDLLLQRLGASRASSRRSSSTQTTARRRATSTTRAGRSSTASCARSSSSAGRLRLLARERRGRRCRALHG